MIRWIRSSLYRKLIVSYLGMLAFMLISTAVLMGVVHYGQVRQVISNRFKAQAVVLHTRLGEELNHLHQTAPASAPATRRGPTRRALVLLRRHAGEASLLLSALVTVRTPDGRCLVQAVPTHLRHHRWLWKRPVPPAARGAASTPSPAPKAGVPVPEATAGGGPQNTPGLPAFRLRPLPGVSLVSPVGGHCLELRKRRSRGRHHRFPVRSLHTLSRPLPLQIELNHLPPFPWGRWRLVPPIYLAIVFAGIALLTIPVSRNITRPLRDLTDAVRRIKAGDLDQEVRPRGHDEVGELAGAVEAMRDSLNRLAEQRRALLSDFSHEIRNPLARMRTVAESVADGLMREPKPLTEAMEGICRQVDEVDQLLEDLLDVARLELPDANRLETTEVGVADLLGETILTLEPAATVERVSLRLADLSTNLGFIEADDRRLRQVLNNILQNAVRHSPDNGVVTLEARRLEGAVRFMVTDEGPGIPVTERERVFERLYRLDPSRARSTGGQGLGLAIARQIVAAHGGDIGVEDGPEGGARFWFEIPTR